jgi:Arc/MetJ-type ribon-helix-helix transcriptional regulator
MKIITINLPEKYLSAIQTLNDLGIYPSRSEAIRIALRDFLNEELKMDQDLEQEAFNELISRNPNRMNLK